MLSLTGTMLVLPVIAISTPIKRGRSRALSPRIDPPQPGLGGVLKAAMQDVTQFEEQVAGRVRFGQAAIHPQRGDLGDMRVIGPAGRDNDFKLRFDLTQGAHEH